MRTKEELDTIKKALKVQRETLPEFSAFGDENWKVIDIQLWYISKYERGESVELEDEDDYSNNYDCVEWLKGEDNDYWDDNTYYLEEL